MSDENALLGQKDANYVESVGFTGLSMAAYPHSSRTDQFAPFSPVNGLDGSAKALPRPSLYLDKSDGTRPLGDEINIPMTVTEAALKDAPAFPLQPPLCDSLAPEAQNLVVGGHGARITLDPGSSVTGSLRASSCHL